MNVKDRIVLITGASSGIGWETALAFARKGAKIAIAARSGDKLQELAQLIREEGTECLAATVDVTDEPSVHAMAEQVTGHYGRIDVLVNNAGFGIFAPVVEADLNDLKAMMEVNYFGIVRCIQAIVPQMMRQKMGYIVNVASVAGFMAAPAHGGYSATKFAVIGLSEALREEMNPYGIMVTTVNPGPIDTPFFDKADIENIPKIAKRFMLKPEQVAREIVHAVELEEAQLVVPRSMSTLLKIKALAPSLFAKASRHFYN